MGSNEQRDASVRDLFEAGRARDPLDDARLWAATQQRLFGGGAPTPVVGRYELVRRIGAGGCGAVWAARDPLLGREVALKLLHPGSAGSVRLLQEARAMAQLQHPNVVSVFEVGSVDALPTSCGDGPAVYLTMELVEGVDLRAWLARTQPAWPDVLALFEQAGRGLAAAHAAGIVHRDFKPANVLVDCRTDPARPRVQVADFGLARFEPTDGPESAADGVAVSATSSVTRFAGTPAYMAPEQYAGGPIGPAADQYAFCVALFEALCGRAPFSGTLRETAAAKAAGRVAPFDRAAGVPRRVVRAIRRGLAPDPHDRYPSMEALLAALSRGAGGRATSRVTIAAALALAVGVIRPDATPYVDAPVEDEPVQTATEHADPDLAARIEARRAELATYHALGDGGAYTEAAVGVDAIAGSPEAAADPSLRAEALMLGGQLRTNTGEYRRALELLEEAHALAVQAGDDELAGRCALSAAFVAGTRLVDTRLAQTWARHAQTRIDRIEGDAWIRVSWHYAQGVIAFSLGRPDEAIEHYERGLALARASNDPRRGAAIVSMTHALGQAHREVDPKASVSILRRAVSLTEQELGHDAPLLMHVLVDLGHALEARGEPVEARVVYERALAHGRRTLGEEHHTLYIPAHALGRSWLASGHPQRAMTYLRDALVRCEAGMGQHHPDAISIHTDVGRALAESGELDAAQRALHRALASGAATGRRVPAAEEALARLEIDDVD